MIFIKNKYYKIYIEIIRKRKIHTLNDDERIEVHHIIPKCMGGNNDPDNLVKLTPKEHFLCHKLLTKITTGEHNKKMWYALNNFLRYSHKNPRPEIKITGRIYSKIKNKQAHIASLENTGVFFWNNGKEQIRSRTCPGPDFVRGRLMNQARKWWTDGFNNKWVEMCPGEKWVPGITKKAKIRWTNGINVKMSTECPGPGWVKGGKPHSEESKLKIKEKRKLQKNIKGKIKL